MFLRVLTLASILLSLSSASAHAVTNRALVIILDDTEKNNHWDATSNDLAIILSQKAGMVLASASVAKNVLIDSGAKTKDARILEGFREEDWVIKKVSDHLVLFIPRGLIHGTGLPFSGIPASTVANDLTDGELRLGLKIDHLPTINKKDIAKLSSGHADEYFLSAFSDGYEIDRNQGLKNSVLIRSGASRFFVLNKDYARYHWPREKRPRWTIVVHGHGEQNKNIAALEFSTFKDFLRLIETTLQLNSLIVSSCYSAGVNIKEVFSQPDVQFSGETFNYPIILQALTDAPTVQLLSVEREERTQRQILKTNHNYVKFYKKAVSASQAQNFLEMIQSIFPVVPDSNFYGFTFTKYWGNAPQIRLPGLSYFSPLAGQNKIVKFDSILVNSHSKERALNINRFFNGIPSAILLSQPDINFEIVIDMPVALGLDAIVSMMPKDAIHRFSKITVNWSSHDESAQQFKNATMLKWFMRIDQLKAKKTFYIEQFNELYDVVIRNEFTPAKRMVGQLASDSFSTRAYFRDKNGQYFVLDSEDFSQIAKASFEEIEVHKQLLAEVKGQVQEIESMRVIQYPRCYQVNPACASSCRIKSIDSNLSVQDVLYAISIERNRLPEGNFILLEQVNGLNGGAISSAKYRDPITLKDVLFLSGNSRGVYYTYNEQRYFENKPIQTDYIKLIKKEGDSRENSTYDVNFNAKLELLLKSKLKDIKKSEEEKIEKTNSLDFTCKKLPKPKYNEPTRVLRDRLRTALDKNDENRAIDILKKNQIEPGVLLDGKNLGYLAHAKGMRKLYAYLTREIEQFEKEFPWVENDAIRKKIRSAFLSYDSQRVIDIIKGYRLAPNARVVISAMSEPLLYHAVQYNMVPLIKYLLDRGANPDIDTEPLMDRLLYGHFIKKRKWNESADEAIALLIEAGAPLRTSSIEGVKTDNVDIIRCLVEKNKSELNSFSALAHAIDRGDPEVIKYIVEQARDQEPSFRVSSYWHLTEALQMNSNDRANDVEIFFYLLNEIQSQVPKVEILERDLDHMLWQALLYYAEFMPLIQKLVELGANVNHDSYSPLMLGLKANGLSGRQRESLIRLLLDRGAKVEQEHIEWAHKKNFHRLAHFLETN